MTDTYNYCPSEIYLNSASLSHANTQDLIAMIGTASLHHIRLWLTDIYKAPYPQNIPHATAKASLLYALASRYQPIDTRHHDLLTACHASLV